MFKGSMVALITPMHIDGSIDYQALTALVDWHLEAKTDAIVVAGTTGESPTISLAEHRTLIKHVVEQVAGRIPVIAGTGSNSTQHTLELSKQAEEAKADACLIVTPYYNKPPQSGLIEHYKVIAENVSLPIILYNVPARTGCDLLPETIAVLAKMKNIIGIKEATGKVERALEIRTLCGDQFAIYSGDDITALALMLNGADGVISVTANVAPSKMHAMCRAALRGEQEEAQALNQELALLHECLFLESNPIPTKWALHRMGKVSAGIRLPLLPLHERYHQKVHQAAKKAGISEWQ